MERNLGIVATTDILTGLQDLLSNEIGLYFQAHFYHWNVKAANFSELHKFFQDAYSLFYNSYDAIAERIRHLGGMVKLPEPGILTIPVQGSDPKAMFERISRDLEVCIVFMGNLCKLMTDLEDSAGQTLVSQQQLEFQDMLWRMDSFTF